MRVLMSAGGTAGHVNPALAIAETIKRNQPDSVIEFVCSREPHDKAVELVPRAGYKLHKIKIRGAYRPLYNPKNFGVALNMLTSRGEARTLIRDFRPDIIIGTGGYACWPLLKVGADMHIPTLVHESNAIPGLAVKMLKNKVDRILVNFEATAEKLGVSPDRVKVTGNPYMDNFRTVSRSEGCERVGLNGKRYVLAFGGSGGARVFGHGVIEAYAKLADKYPDTVFAMASGKRYIDEMTQAAKASGLDGKENVRISDYIYDMPYHMAAADIVVCRSGAMTLSELALTGCASVMVPSPNVTDNHQYKNAKVISDAGAGVLVEESELECGRLTSELERLLNDRELREKCGCTVKQRFAMPDSNRIIYSEITKLLAESAKN